MGFNEDWRYQFTHVNNFCLLELIQVALGHLDDLQKAENIPLSGRYRQVTLYIYIYIYTYIYTYTYIGSVSSQALNVYENGIKV